MTYRNAVLFCLAPLAEGTTELYPGGRQTLAGRNARLDTGVDLVVPADTVVRAGETAAIDLGVRAVCLRRWAPPASAPPGAVLQIDAPPQAPVEMPWAFWLLARSSIGRTPLMLVNAMGLIDLGYRGPLVAKVWNRGPDDFLVERGCALFQLAAADLAPAEYEVLAPEDPRTAEYFGEGATRRGSGGFGSTGGAGSAAPLE